MAAFDITSVIGDFRDDAKSTSLVLPHMTTGQRKQAKKVLEQFPDLRCESFGFGQERQLHVFKQDGTLTAQRTLTQQDIQVRNTFVHIADTPVDERVVQSMPHGMFSQCVAAERSCKEAACDSSVVASDAAGPVSEPEAEPTAAGQDVTEQPPWQRQFGPGALVIVEGLTKLPAFNGLSAVVQGWDESSCRYSIVLVNGSSGCQQAKVKEENLRLLLSCP
jgi:hypothetical protein